MVALRDWTVPNLVGLAAVAAAGGVCLTTLAGAWSLDPLPAAAAPTIDGFPAVARRAAADGLPSERFALLFGDPFQSDRAYPAAEYAAGAEAPADPTFVSAAPSQAIKLQGVAFLPGGGGLAVLSVGGRPAQLVRPGQVVEGLRLARVDSAGATLIGADTTVVLRLPDGQRSAPRRATPAAPPATAAAGASVQVAQP
jgi:hypothetical protein